MTKWKTTQYSFAALALTALAGAGCSSSNSEEPAAASSQGDEVTPAEGNTELTQGQILNVLATVDSGEIAQAQLAVTKATAPQVRQFANDMIEMHSRSKQEGAQFAEQSGITLSSSKLSNTLENKGSAELRELETTDASKFDKTYMHAQVKQHQEVLDKVNSQLIPAANATTRDQLETARGMVQQHLADAKKIDEALTM